MDARSKRSIAEASEAAEAPPSGAVPAEKRSKKRAREAAAAEALAGAEAEAQSAAEKEAAAAPPPPQQQQQRKPARAPAPAPAPDHAVYTEGWPWDATDEQLRAFFAPCGALVDLKAPRWQDSGRLRGYAHVRFDSAAAVAAALALSGAAVGARFVTVKAANPLGGSRAPPPRQAPQGCRTLHVHNLPYDADEAAIEKVFQRHGNVASVRIARRYDTHASKGFAYVEFEGKAGAEAAVAASLAPGGLLVGGRAARLDYDTGAGPRASFKTADGRALGKGGDSAGGGGKGGGGGGKGGGGGGKGGGQGKRVNAGVAAHDE
jgi:nucleolin